MSIGKDPTEIDDESPDNHDVAAALGFDDLEDEADGRTDDEKSALDLSDEKPDDETMWELVWDLAADLEETKAQLEAERRKREREQQERKRLEERFDELQQEQNRAQRTRKEIAANVNDLSNDVDDIEETVAETQEMVQSANAIAQQAKSVAETGQTAMDQEDVEKLPGGVEPSSSPLDFLANCRELRVKKHLVDQGTPRRNRFRGLKVMKRWDEFATIRTTGDGLFWTKDDVERALTAILGEDPHGTTVKRVWEEMKALGSDDVDVTDRQISPQQPKKEIIAMDRETAEGLFDARYHHLELLDPDGKLTGGVTPVVMEQDTAEV